MTVTIETMVNRWTDPNARPLFKGKLIDPDGCCCAQGDVLRCSGWSDEQLRKLTQENADKEVAKILGISRGRSILLRQVNDSQNGCPQDVLINPAKILGPNAKVVIAFWKHLDTLDWDSWKKVITARAAAGEAAREAARAAAREAARQVAWEAAREAAWEAAGEAAREAARAAARQAAGQAAWEAAWEAAREAAGQAARQAAWEAAWECVGISHLASPFFLKFFFEDVTAWLATVEKE